MVVNDKGVRFARIFDGTKKPPHFMKRLIEYILVLSRFVVGQV